MTRGTGHNLFRKWRDYRGLTQEVVAERSGLPKSTISKLENGTKTYTQGHLEALAHALDCEPSDLIGRMPGAPSELTLLVNRVPPDSVAAVAAVIRAIIKAA
ncbi:MAG: XRE family transcriptional regulator [Caulobacteraceae bacterium]|nr:XRE family transcriptional regulator [Caulobacteraceae bacterium]